MLRLMEKNGIIVRSRFSQVCIGIALLSSTLLCARSITPSLYAGGDYGYTDNDADAVSGAFYDKKYTNPLTAHAGLGVTFSGRFYFGARYEYWFSGRTFRLGTNTSTDTLDYRLVGAEVGYTQGNHRVHFTFMAGAMYPLTLQVNAVSEGTTTNYTDSSLNLTYHANIMMTIRFSFIHSFYAQLGYRLNNPGDLTANGTSYISAENPDFDLSGLTLGTGILFSL